MTTIAVANQKGGVGKTTLTFNLAKLFASQGWNTLVVDNDPQGNLTASLLEDPSALEANVIDIYQERPPFPQKVAEHLHLLGSDVTLATLSERGFQVVYRLREVLASWQQQESSRKFDYVLIDCLPSIGYLHIAALNAADYVLIPTKPNPYALVGMKDLLATIRKTRLRLNRNLRILGIVLNQVDGRKTVLEQKLEQVLRDNYGELVFNRRLNKRIRYAESPTFRKGITEYRPKDVAAIEFRLFAEELLERINGGREDTETVFLASHEAFDEQMDSQDEPPPPEDRVKLASGGKMAARL